MPEILRVMAEQAHQALPFMVAASQGKGPTLNTPRILEAILIAAILGAGAWLFLVPKLDFQFKYMQQEMGEMSSDMKALRQDVEALKLDLAVEKAIRSKPVSP